MQINYQDRIFGLDVMRAIAILFVVCSHALWVFPEAEGSFISLLRLSGVMGVEIFFVLSGFLIGRILFRIFTNASFSRKHLTYFLYRRWFRTLPNYYLVLLINIFVVLYLGRALPISLPYYFGFLQNFWSGMDIFFTESWSLPIEEFAYIIGPLLFYLVLLFKWRTPKKYLFLLVTLLIIAFFTGTKIWYNAHVGATTLAYWNINLKAVLLFRIDAIYYGVLAAYLSMVFPKSWAKFTASAFFFGLFIYIGVYSFIGSYQMTPENYPFFLNVMYLPLTSICIACSLPFFSRLQRGPSLLRKPITFISIVSYSMYLLHYSVILQLMNYFISTEGFTIVQKIAYASSYILITIILSYLLYRFFEKPMMDIRDSGYFKRKYRSD